jgi:hypothetical protein
LLEFPPEPAQNGKGEAVVAELRSKAFDHAGLPGNGPPGVD